MKIMLLLLVLGLHLTIQAKSLLCNMVEVHISGQEKITITKRYLKANPQITEYMIIQVDDYKIVSEGDVFQYRDTAKEFDRYQKGTATFGLNNNKNITKDKVLYYHDGAIIMMYKCNNLK